MLFNSLDFALFLPIVFFLYWFVANKSLKAQNLLIVVASYFFYGWWDWRFLSLIAFSTLVDFIVGIKLAKAERKIQRRLWLAISICVNLGLLGFFKYFNFFLDNFKSAFSFFGSEINLQGLNIILPVGISFYTFQTLSYSIDVYRRKVNPTNDLVAFTAFVSFFPQLVAGPIERASNLLPQFLIGRSFEYLSAVDGLRQILWGLIKKIVIADSCAIISDDIFNNYYQFSGLTLFAGAVAFTFQIYGDFSGYSDIAIGTSRLFGFNLMQNFAFPYFSRDIAEFWRRWHISLSTWFRDYLYIPLGGSKGSLFRKIRNTFIIFLVSGFWHGANWTFIFWGLLNALYFIPLLILNKNRRHLESPNKGLVFADFKTVFSILLTFTATVFAWILFRSPDLGSALSYIKHIFTGMGNAGSYIIFWHYLLDVITLSGLIMLIVFIVMEWLGRENKYAIEKMFLKMNRMSRWLIYSSMVLIIIYFSGNEQEFIYFQF